MGCDCIDKCCCCILCHFNPRTHRGVRHSEGVKQIMQSAISIHAPIVGCDNQHDNLYSSNQRFQSTHPSWGATKNSALKVTDPTDFNPRTHRGVRQNILRQQIQLMLFQSTHPSWGATSRQDNRFRIQKNFNPRTHRGVRPQK